MGLRFGRVACGALLAACIAFPVMAEDAVVEMRKTSPEGPGEAIGTISVADSDGGVVFKLELHSLPPGPHGFHVHENGTCGPTLSNDVRIPAGAAGGHFDPDHTGHHAGPEGDGHKGDLPALVVAADGTAQQTLVAPHVTSAADLKGHALMIHSGGDNYSDSPAPLGGGGGRFACGVVQ